MDCDSWCKENTLQMTQASYSWETFLFGQRHKCRNGSAGNHHTDPISACESLAQVLSTSNHLLICKDSTNNSSCFQNNEDTNFLPWPCPSHIPATSSLCLQREWEAASQKVTKRKPVAGICCKNAFREGEILVLKNSWQSITYCFFLVLIFPLFCMHLYCLFPFFFFPPFFFSAEGLLVPLPPTHLQLCSRPAWSHQLSHSCPQCQATSTLAAQLTAHSAPARQGGGSLLPPNTQIANPQSLLNAASYQADQGRRDAFVSEQEGCYWMGCAATPAPFSPSSSSFSLSPLALVQAAAPLCQQGISQHRPVGAGGTTATSHRKPT